MAELTVIWVVRESLFEEMAFGGFQKWKDLTQ